MNDELSHQTSYILKNKKIDYRLIDIYGVFEYSLPELNIEILWIQYQTTSRSTAIVADCIKYTISVFVSVSESAQTLESVI